MQGNSVSIPTGSSALSAIDTGTTLIGGPSDAVQAVWAAVNGSQALKGNMEGFFAFRKCHPSSILALPLPFAMRLYFEVRALMQRPVRSLHH